MTIRPFYAQILPFLLCFIALQWGFLGANAQGLIQSKRNGQLLGNPRLANQSLTINPLEDLAPLDTLNPSPSQLKITLLPLTWVQQYNSHHPYGMNDGAMIAAKGWQNFLQIGAHAQWKNLEWQIAPEAVWAANPSYASSPAYGSNAGGPYTKLFPGQSFAKIRFGKISLGLSSQNRWWGPGIRSSLLMSNNAPGFLHGFIGTHRPIKTPIGHIEFQLIGAKLSSNLSRPFENAHLKTKPGILANNRYQNAMVLSYQPRWVPGLYLGFTRSIQRYYKDIALSGSFLNQYLPILFKPLAKSNALADDTMKTDQQASLFLRWVLPKSKAEIYVELGKNDYGYNVRDYLLAPSHSMAYTVGFRKLFQQSSTNYLVIESEITQMSQSPDFMVRGAGNWYEHGQILEGYTHQNQIMGTGAGFGANIQTLAASLFHENISNEWQLQRIEHDPLLSNQKWTDIALGWLHRKKFNHLFVNANVQMIFCKNYAWENGKNPINLHFRFMLQYMLNTK